MEFDSVIVGSGPAGIAAALELNQSGTAILDVGESPITSFQSGSLSDAKRLGNLEQLLGPNWEMLANLKGDNIHSKLRSSQLRFIESGEPYSVTGKYGNVVNQGRGSYACGGFANAWGAQVYRYTQHDFDLLGDWPISASDLDPYYRKIESHMGVSGLNDDLSTFFGNSNLAMPPSPLVCSANALLSRYQKNKVRLNRQGLTLGRPRLALLTQKYNDYPPYRFGESEFFNSEDYSIYNPKRTLEELTREGKISYLSRMRLDKYVEKGDHVYLTVINVDTGEMVSIKTRKLFLACGTLQTARLVLMSNKEKKRLPVLEHPPVLIPAFMPSQIGRSLPIKSYPIQLAGCLNHEGDELMLTLYYAGGMLRSDILMDLPFNLKDNLWLLNRILSGLIVAQVWYPSRPDGRNRMSLSDCGEIRLDYPVTPDCGGLSKLSKLFRSLGLYTHERLAKLSPVGWGFHFAGTLPMSKKPSSFETDQFGRLWNCKHVYAIDGSILPSLPAKNLTLTIMANAARVARRAVQLR